MTTPNNIYQLLYNAKRIRAELDEYIKATEQMVSTPLTQKLNLRVKDFTMSGRTRNVMHNEGIEYIGELVTRSPSEYLRVPNCGRRSVNEILTLVGALDLKLSMEQDELQGWVRPE